MSSAPTAAPDGARTFAHVLVNTLVANVTTSFLWFALTFWVYLETRSVLATGIVGGAYMLMLALFAMLFGTLVDRHRKRAVLVGSSLVTMASFAAAGALYAVVGPGAIVDMSGPWFWLFAGIVLFGSVVESMRNIALSTLVTLLVPQNRRDRANGLVGTVQGIAFIVTSVFSGLAIGQLGMGWTLLIANVLTIATLVHLFFVQIAEDRPEFAADAVPTVDVRGALAAIALVPGLFALIVLTTFNNLVSGVFMALMDPYGLTLFTVEQWGLIFGLASTGFILGGLMIARWGLGANPLRTMLWVLVAMGVINATFTLREWPWLCIGGIWLFLLLVPAVEAAEQTIIQRVVPFRSQGRVFGFAQAFESAAAPVTAFLVAPIAEFWVIPHLDSEAGAQQWAWLVGHGDARGIALIFWFAGLVMVFLALAAFGTRAYRILSERYRDGEVVAESSDP
ncbi:MFS transporter [Aeromicrobium senzhongii]|uniref:MFS transporter n=1 Tax=Aeromicrobium senzhongii TaxID=2663859 RepID=A0ABX6SW08_9ACTN|nr:MFS transporter [Aeromicrobium senzhongii]MTB86762.1 MFS transporter [Aeromicrobium senzhongii]QNL93390.1 MFS transporter [Aeromicrobium senzhongii]